MAENDFLKKIV